MRIKPKARKSASRRKPRRSPVSFVVKNTSDAITLLHEIGSQIGCIGSTVIKLESRLGELISSHHRVDQITRCAVDAWGQLHNRANNREFEYMQTSISSIEQLVDLGVAGWRVIRTSGDEASGFVGVWLMRQRGNA